MKEVIGLEAPAYACNKGTCGKCQNLVFQGIDTISCGSCFIISYGNKGQSNSGLDHEIRDRGGEQCEEQGNEIIGSEGTVRGRWERDAHRSAREACALDEVDLQYLRQSHRTKGEIITPQPRKKRNTDSNGKDRCCQSSKDKTGWTKKPEDPVRPSYSNHVCPQTKESTRAERDLSRLPCHKIPSLGQGHVNEGEEKKIDNVIAIRIENKRDDAKC